MIKILTNENIPLLCVHLLNELGYDIIHTGIEFPGVTDYDVIQFSEKENRIIITITEYARENINYLLLPKPCPHIRRFLC